MSDMHEFAPGWLLASDHLPHWLVVKLVTFGGDAAPEPPVASAILQLADEQSQHRIIFELADNVLLGSRLVGQLVELHKRLYLKSGALRLCGLSDHNFEVIRLMRLQDRLPNYATREAAIAGTLPGV